MKLYLSSYRLGNRADTLKGLVAQPGRAGLIFNALDHYEERLRDFEREAEDLEQLGFSSRELDLRRFFGNPTALTAELELARSASSLR